MHNLLNWLLVALLLGVYVVHKCIVDELVVFSVHGVSTVCPSVDICSLFFFHLAIFAY